MIYFTYFVILSSVWLSACSCINRYWGLEDDNIYEEIAEGALKFETGIDVDFTPETPE